MIRMFSLLTLSWLSLHGSTYGVAAGARLLAGPSHGLRSVGGRAAAVTVASAAAL